MKIAIVCPYSMQHWGGVQHQAANLVTWLRDAGHEAWLVAPDAGPPAHDVGATNVVRINRSRAPLALRPSAIRRTRRAVADADVVHIHEPFMPAVSLAALLGESPPRVGTFHADTGALVAGLYRAAGTLLRSWAQRLSVATAVSPVAQRSVASITATEIIPNGIDVAGYERAVERQANRVVFLGRDDPRKGLDVLLRAWERVPAGFELLVIGAARDEAPSGVRFLGRVAEDEKLDMLASAAVLCAPNTGEESFGLIVAEGMAAGCAVVASGIPAFAAVLGDAGLLVPPRDPAALAETITALLRSPEQAAALGKAARNEVRRFDRSSVVAAYLDAYRRAASVAS